MPEQHAKHMYSQALALGELGRTEDEIAAYDEIDHRYGKDENPAIRKLVDWALKWAALVNETSGTDKVEHVASS